MSAAAAKASVDERLRVREGERLARAEERARARDEDNLESETTAHFDARFATERTAIEKMLSAASGFAKEERPAHFDKCVVAVRQLQAYVNTCTHFLSGYDLRAAQRVVANLEARQMDERARLVPRQKFRFKNRLARAGTGTNSSTGTEDREDGRAAAVSAAEEAGGALGSKDMDSILADFQVDKPVTLPESRGVTHVLDAEALAGKDVRLSKLTQCRVFLEGAPSTVHLAGLTDCVVCIGPTARSVFVSDCQGCRLAIACQQLRVHTTYGTDIYLHVTSRAIIEDCNTLRFAPYTWDFDQRDALFTAAGLDRERNNWNDVDDFKWLKEDEASPNWGLVPEVERVTTWARIA